MLVSYCVADLGVIRAAAGEKVNIERCLAPDARCWSLYGFVP
jgi:hypothetical protein